MRVLLELKATSPSPPPMPDAGQGAPPQSFDDPTAAPLLADDQRAPEAPGRAPTGAYVVRKFEDGSALYEDGLVYDPSSHKFRKPRTQPQPATDPAVAGQPPAAPAASDTGAPPAPETKAVRHVRTPEGVRLFNQPIGSPIRPHVLPTSPTELRHGGVRGETIFGVDVRKGDRLSIGVDPSVASAIVTVASDPEWYRDERTGIPRANLTFVNALGDLHSETIEKYGSKGGIFRHAPEPNPPAGAAPFTTISGRDLLKRVLDLHRDDKKPLTANEKGELGRLASVITPDDYGRHTMLLGNPTHARRVQHTRGWVDLSRSVRNLRDGIADDSDARRVAAWLWNWHRDPKNDKLDVDNVDVSLPAHQVAAHYDTPNPPMGAVAAAVTRNVRERGAARRAKPKKVPGWFPKHMLLPQERESGYFIDTGHGLSVDHLPPYGGAPIDDPAKRRERAVIEAAEYLYQHGVAANRVSDADEASIMRAVDKMYEGGWDQFELDHGVYAPSPPMGRREYARHTNVPIHEVQLDDRIDGETVVQIDRADTGEYDITTELPDGMLLRASYSEDSILDIDSPVGPPPSDKVMSPRRDGKPGYELIEPNGSYTAYNTSNQADYAMESVTKPPTGGGISDETMKLLRKRKAAAKFYAQRKHGMTRDEATTHAGKWWDHALGEVRAGRDVPHHLALLGDGGKTKKPQADPRTAAVRKAFTDHLKNGEHFDAAVAKGGDFDTTVRKLFSDWGLHSAYANRALGYNDDGTPKKNATSASNVVASLEDLPAGKRSVMPHVQKIENGKWQSSILTSVGYGDNLREHHEKLGVHKTRREALGRAATEHAKRGKTTDVHEVRTYPSELEVGDNVLTQKGSAKVTEPVTMEHGTYGKHVIKTDKGTITTHSDVNRLLDVPPVKKSETGVYTSSAGNHTADVRPGKNGVWYVHSQRKPGDQPFYAPTSRSPMFGTAEAAHAHVPVHLAIEDDHDRRAELYRQKSRARVDAMTAEDLKRERASIEEQGRDMGGWHPQWLNESDLRDLLKEAEDPKWGNGYGTYGVPSYYEIQFSAPLLRSMLKLPPKKLGTGTKGIIDLDLWEAEKFDLELETKTAHRVRTLEGSRRFGIPIGAIIDDAEAGRFADARIAERDRTAIENRRLRARGMPPRLPATFDETPPRRRRPTVRERVAAQGAEADKRIAEREKLAKINEKRRRRGLAPLASIKSLEQKGTTRHVRTPEGARRFGVPIGSIIRLDEAGNLIPPVRGSAPNAPSLHVPKTPDVDARAHIRDINAGKLGHAEFDKLPAERQAAIRQALERQANIDRTNRDPNSQAQQALNFLRRPRRAAAPSAPAAPAPAPAPAPAAPAPAAHVPKTPGADVRAQMRAINNGKFGHEEFDKLPAERQAALKQGLERQANIDRTNGDKNSQAQQALNFLRRPRRSQPAGASGGYGVTKSALNERGDGDRPMPAGAFSRGDPRNDPEYADYVKNLERTIDQALGAGLDSETQHTVVDQKTGVRAYTAARTREHLRILDKIMTDNEHVPSERKAIMLGGLPGAGKSTFLKSHGAELGLEMDDDGNPTNAIVINPDEMKSLLINGVGIDGQPLTPSVPGINKGEMSELTHEESSYLANLLAERSLAQGKNVVFDITLGDGEKARAKYLTNGRGTGAKDRGYSVEAAFVDGDMATSLHRAGLRHKQPNPQTGERGYSGRFVRYEHIESQKVRDPKAKASDGTKPRSQNRLEFDQLSASGLFDRAVRYDNVSGEFFDNEGHPLPPSGGVPSPKVDEDALRRELLNETFDDGSGGHTDEVAHDIMSKFAGGQADQLDPTDQGRLRISLQRSNQTEALDHLIQTYGDDFGRGVDPDWDSEFTKPKGR